MLRAMGVLMDKSACMCAMMKPGPHDPLRTQLLRCGGFLELRHARLQSSRRHAPPVHHSLRPSQRSHWPGRRPEPAASISGTS